jgi:DNA-binding transcriptional MerR regulator
LNKAPDAFRTISEVADDLDLPQHVLRFWESRFPQIRPMKRGGGRRYYRPEDVELLRGIRHLLYGEGYTIRGVQRILREQGLRTVQSVGQGRVVNLPAPSREDKANGQDHAETGQNVLKFRPSLFLEAAEEGGPDRNPEQPPDEGDEVPLPSAALPLGSRAEEARANMPPEMAAEAAPRPVAPVMARLAPEELDRLKTALHQLEECRRMLDGAVGAG